VVVPGNHDGVHRGHRALLDEARKLAEPEGLRVVAMFFDPHPLRVLAPDRAPVQLTTPERRTELLRSAGADEVAVQPFDDRFARLTPEQFVDEVLVGSHGARFVVVGPDFRFGRGRVGDVDTLRELGGPRNLRVHTVKPVQHGDAPVSSSRVRARLAEGNVRDATLLLSRVHDVEGVVVEGDRRGRTLGFPTANLDFHSVQLPADGIYAVSVRRMDQPGSPRLQGAASLGQRPTFEGAGRSFEVYLLDFDGDLYGTRLRVGFVQHIRGEQRFDGVEALKQQMNQDVQRAREILAETDEELVAWI
jgi:riboflavin kinase/FMN adenylyltransferase